MSTKLEEIENKMQQIEIYEQDNKDLSCGDSLDSLNSNQSDISEADSPIKEEPSQYITESFVLENVNNEGSPQSQQSSPEPIVLGNVKVSDEYYEEETVSSQSHQSCTLIKRAHLKNLIHEIYDLNQTDPDEAKTPDEPSFLIESFMEKLPPRKNLKNSILLAWKKRFFRLSSIGILSVHDFDGTNVLNEPIETYNLMGARVVYEQNEVISLDDCRGQCVVFRCCNDDPEEQTKNINKEQFLKWKSTIDSQIIDRSDSLWVKPNKALPVSTSAKNIDRNVLIIDIGTCSIRAGLFDSTPQLPTLFIPTCCSKDQNGSLKVGFDAFDSLFSSTAPSTIDLSKSTWSLNSTVNFSSNQLMFPLKNKAAIDKLNVDISSIDAIINYVVETLNISCQDYEILIITPQKFSDKLNIQFLNLLLEDEKYQFKSVSLMNQSLLALYSYNSSIGVVANLGEKIDIVPICNGLILI